ncbi:DUF4236 domain-containing protein [Cecembia sp.]|uniref:DUF4236 domain-containing protein n=1 Tax=Cecembia sp. TaxID=1898110 RepID=UPI0025BCE1E6|nr:DUF4236 domain-containing protein [Cecembia sp.]
MPFYIRKGLNFGPIRVNLSKSGLGFSSGVKGARLGINSQGKTYLHGGRHGLYYRKNLGSLRKNGTTLQGTYRNLTETEEIFTDTGLSYPVFNTQKSSLQIPALPYPANKKTLYLGVGLIIVALIVSVLWLKISLGIVGVVLVYNQMKTQTKENNFLTALYTLVHLGPEEMTGATWKDTVAKFSEKDRIVLASQVLPAWLEKQIQKEEIITLDEIKQFLPVSPELVTAIALDTYRDLVAQLISDHQLTSTEESFIQEVESKWNLPQEAFTEEQKLISQFKNLREIQFQGLPEVNFTRDLVKGEKPFFEGEGRLLNLRTLNTWQQDRVRYKEMGYVLDMEGRLRISNRVLEIQDEQNTRTYAIRLVDDIHLSVEEGVVEVFLSNRKNPLVISSPLLFEFAGILNRVSEMED